MRVIVTAPPYADFLDELLDHPLVEGLRLNTVMPVSDRDEVLGRLAEACARRGKTLWVDLKYRQLRVARAALPPFTEVELSHPIEVPVPCDAWFGDGEEHARVVAVDGRRLILAAGPRRVIGPGESVNVVHPELRVHGGLTEGDRAWLAAMRTRGLREVMLSYVESPQDLDAVRAELPEARIVAKIESRRGLAVAPELRTRLMAARGDLYVEVREPHRVLAAVRRVLAADPEAIVASRILSSLAWRPVPSCADLGDLAFLLQLGYRHFMLGDHLCLERDPVIGALNLLQALARDSW